MASADNLTNLKAAVLLNRGPVQAIEWRHYLEDNWLELTEHIPDGSTILFLTGRHGNEDGSIGPHEDHLTSEQKQQVKVKILSFAFNAYFRPFISRIIFLNEI